MTKTITSPSKRFPGTVDLPDYLDWVQLEAYQGKFSAITEGMTTAQASRLQAEAVIGVVQAWHIEGLPAAPAQLPASIAGVKLLGWLINEISELIGDDDPEGSPPNA
jgi:hypothetical protein